MGLKQKKTLSFVCYVCKKEKYIGQTFFLLVRTQKTIFALQVSTTIIIIMYYTVMMMMMMMMTKKEQQTITRPSFFCALLCCV
jgi:hypothetical protein